jgi:hypothetical protein
MTERLLRAMIGSFFKVWATPAREIAPIAAGLGLRSGESARHYRRISGDVEVNGDPLPVNPASSPIEAQLL